MTVTRLLHGIVEEGIMSKCSGSNRVAVALTGSALWAWALVGCAGYRPVVAGEGYLGLGWFRDFTYPEHSDYEVIDVEGVGILTMRGRLIVGYADYSIVNASEPDTADFRLLMSNAEFAVGAEAEAWAREINDQHDHELLRVQEKRKEVQR